MSIKPRSVPTKQLAQNLSSTALVMYLNNTLDWDQAQLSSTDFGTQLFALLRNAANTKIEILEIDPATVTSAAAITILKRGLGYDGTQVTGTETQYAWVAGDTFVEIGSDSPQLLALFVDQFASETIDGVKTFSSLPATTAGNPIAANDLARKGYVDSLLAGIASTVSLIVSGTAGETLVAGNLVYLKAADGRWWKVDADTAATVDNVILGIAQGAGSAAGAVTNGIMIQGIDANQSGLTPSTIYYASNTAGGVSSSVGTTEVTVGFAKSATELYFNPRFNQQLTEDQQDALAGSSGTPSATNKFLTELGFYNAGYFGDGADGALVYDGAATILGMAPAANVYTLTRDIFATDITINNGITLKPGGYRIYATGTLTNNGTISRNGVAGGTGANGSTSVDGTADAAGGTAGTALASGTLYGSAAGKAGGVGQGNTNGDAGTAGASETQCTVGTNTGAVGGKGGNGTGGFSNQGGTASAGGAGTALVQPVKTIFRDMFDYNGIIKARAGSGSGGGGAAGNNGSGGSTMATGGGGGGSGSNGGTIFIAAKIIINNSTKVISANGGNGGNGGNGVTSGAGNSGGGGGGGGGAGGLIVLVYRTLTNSGTITVTGGTAGTKGAQGGGGTAADDGAAGADGELYQFQMN